MPRSCRPSTAPPGLPGGPWRTVDVYACEMAFKTTLLVRCARRTGLGAPACRVRPCVMRTAAREQPEAALPLSELPPLERNRVSWMTAGPDSPRMHFRTGPVGRRDPHHNARPGGGT